MLRRNELRRTGHSDEEFRKLRSEYLDQSYRLGLVLIAGFIVLIAIELLSRGSTRHILLIIYLLWPLIFLGLIIRFAVTTSRRYKSERRRRGLKRFGRIGQWGAYFAEEDSSTIRGVQKRRPK
jgi:hypothetical protein